MSFPPLPMEQTFTSHLFSQALSSKEQRLAFLSQPEAPKSGTPEAAKVEPTSETERRLSSIAGAIGDTGKAGAYAILAPISGLTVPVVGPVAGAVLGYKGIQSAKGAYGHLKDAISPSAPSSTAPLPSYPEFRQPHKGANKGEKIEPAPSAPTPAPATPEDKTAKDSQDATEKAKNAETEQYEREKAAQEKTERELAEKKLKDSVDKFVKDNQATIDDLNKFDKENNKTEFSKKLDELNKKIEDIKDPKEKSKVLEAIKQKLEGKNIMVKVDMRLVIDEPKVAPAQTQVTPEKQKSFIEQAKENITAVLEILATALGFKDVKTMIDAFKNAKPSTLPSNASTPALETAKTQEQKEIEALKKQIAELKKQSVAPRGNANVVPAELQKLQKQVETHEQALRRIEAQLPRARVYDTRYDTAVLELRRRSRDWGVTVEDRSDKRTLHFTPRAGTNPEFVRYFTDEATQRFGRVNIVSDPFGRGTTISTLNLNIAGNNSTINAAQTGVGTTKQRVTVEPQSTVAAPSKPSYVPPASSSPARPSGSLS